MLFASTFPNNDQISEQTKAGMAWCRVVGLSDAENVVPAKKNKLWNF